MCSVSQETGWMSTSYAETVTDAETVAQTLATNNHPHKPSCLQAFSLHAPKTHALTNPQIYQVEKQKGD